MPRRIQVVSLGYPSAARAARMLFTHEQAKALAELGAEVEVLDLAPEEGPVREERVDGLDVLRLPLPRRFRPRPDVALALARAARLIATRARARRHDLVLASFVEQKYAPLVPALRAGGARVAFTAHGVDVMPESAGPIGRLLKRWLLLEAAHVFAPSEATADLARALLPPSSRSKVSIVENGVDRAKLDRALRLDRAELRRGFGWPSERPVLLSVANLVPRKGLDRLVAAVRCLVDRGRDFLHVIVGRGPERDRLEAQARALDVHDRVRFIDRTLSDDELSGAMWACDAFALGSRTLRRPAGMEGFGVVYAEAGYLGRPVVAGASGGVPSVVLDGVTGLLVDPEATDAAARFADALERVLFDAALAERLGAAARERARARYDWRANAARVLELTSSGVRCTSG